MEEKGAIEGLMKKWANADSSEEREKIMAEMEKAWEEMYGLKPGRRYCPACMSVSPQEKFGYSREEVERSIFDNKKEIHMKDVILKTTCPNCRNTTTEVMVQPSDYQEPELYEEDEQVVYCEDCKKPLKIKECKLQKDVIVDSEMYAYGTYSYHCPTCFRIVKEITF